MSPRHLNTIDSREFIKKAQHDGPFEFEAKNVGFFEHRRRAKMVKEYYNQQKRLLKMYQDDAELLNSRDVGEIKQLAEQGREDKKDQMEWDRHFATIVLFVNVTVFLGNLTASILSGSYSIVSVFVDSVMDLMSSAVVHLSIWSINNTDPTKYPRGRQSLELIAVICCSVFMATSNLFMILQSVQAIISDDVNPSIQLSTITIVFTTILTKSMVMIAGYRHGSNNSKMVAMDQRNDIFNNLVSLTCAYIGDRYWKFADPIGAICICTFIASTWFRNAISQVPLIVGKQADREEISRILALSLNHDDRIKYLDHVMVYHVGELALVELHIVLDEYLPLKVTHDICEQLQDKINSLEFVERSFIHVDYFCDGLVDGKMRCFDMIALV
ncbi:Cation diffusion facilitator family transporter [Aphelenchoides bicaudatus]|nr:Cation diffusion facilitator family transporter [Aphelenchoides bicaudatus]